MKSTLGCPDKRRFGPKIRISGCSGFGKRVTRALPKLGAVTAEALLIIAATAAVARSAALQRPDVSQATGNAVDLYVVRGTFSLAGQAKPNDCPKPSDGERDDVNNLVQSRLNSAAPTNPPAPNPFSVRLKKTPSDPDILGSYLNQALPAYVVIARVCDLTSDSSPSAPPATPAPPTPPVVTLSVTGYALAKAAVGPWLSAPSADQPAGKPAICVPRYRWIKESAPSLTCTSGTLGAMYAPNGGLTAWDLQNNYPCMQRIQLIQPRLHDQSGPWSGALCQLSQQDWSNVFGYAGKADVYVVRTSVNGSQPCARHAYGLSQIQAIEAMVAAHLTAYDVVVKSTGPDAPADILAPYLSPFASVPQSVVLSTVCRTLDVSTVSVAGYAFQPLQKPTSGSLGGTFDTLEVGDWSSLFGTATLFPTVAFLPVVNDTSSVINPRLLHNLPLTLIATPAPAPIAPPPPGASAPPQPPATRLAECQASAYRILVAGRTTTSSQRPDLTRLILAAAGLKSTAPTPWGPVWTVLGAAAGILYIPNSAEAGVNVFVCPTKQLLLSANPPFNLPRGMDPSKVIFEVGGLDHAIVGHKVTPAIGLDPYVQQGVLDTAVVDLADQVDCVITLELAKMQMLNVLGNPPVIDDVAASSWCTKTDPKLDPYLENAGYFAKLEGTNDYLSKGNDSAVTTQLKSQFQGP